MQATAREISVSPITVMEMAKPKANPIKPIKAHL
jgi:hypothetical protein